MRAEEFFRGAAARQHVRVAKMPPGAFSGLGSAPRLSNSGLNGYWSTMGCTAHELALDALKVALDRAEKSGLQQADAYIEAKRYFDNNPIVYPWSCEENTAYAGQVLKKLNAVLGSKADEIPAPVAEQMTDAHERTKPPEETPFWVKATVIGGLSVAGLITVAVLAGQLGPLLAVFKKVTK